MTLILGIESSCDETAAAVVADGRHILSNVVASQIELHRRYGGVFPEVASRQHILTIHPVITQAMAESGIGWDDLDAVAVTRGPGLAGSLLVGVNVAKGLAWGRGLPLIGINHLEGHIYSNWLETEDSPLQPPPFPLLILIVSGGHTELLLMEGHGVYRWLGGTLDDAAGEAFDKVARLLRLPYPGGPAIQQAAEGSDPTAFSLPRGLARDRRHPYDFSFSGLKTAVLRLVRDLEAAGGELPVGDIAASFQLAVVDVLVQKTAAATEAFGVKHVCVCGGVAANAELRRQLAARLPVPYSIPPIRLCTDNAAMIAAAGFYRFRVGERSEWDMDVEASLRLA
ncbi:MAG TPA: tRNA (adenosine(37)-N6)-threonylcarbamoyltransferase complex transferase subunit TsaD [Anaerolineae bacterium]|nr:tRNA (adenosine(37)-N6)-threonylcarbamoyltransferase complex transferase subunit TsaD [Anaerolineae bacterium]HIQ04868.1 tRNA (adenosine(37)-N6)-threonylcarbamoyltransferase complex transferase subunit TsaD [Anaerolineae bacterium]